MFSTLYSFQSIFTNTISIGLIWSPQNPRKYMGSVYCVSGRVHVHVNFIFYLILFFYRAQRNRRLRGVWWVTVTTGICQTCQTKRKLLAKPSNLKLLTSYYTWKLVFPLVYVLSEGEYALGSTQHLGAPSVPLSPCAAPGPHPEHWPTLLLSFSVLSRRLKGNYLFFHPKKPKPLNHVLQKYLDFKTLLQLYRQSPYADKHM